ncbi:MAG: hypothetical protein D6796_04660, partial [Caldilineae bacterium]
PPGATARTTRHTARQTRIAVRAPAPFRATFRTLYWPEWDISLWQDGERWRTLAAADIAITHPDGLLSANLPAGEYEIRLQRRATPIRRAATALSVLSLLALAGVLWAGRRDRTAEAASPATLSRRQAAAIGVAILAGVAAVQFAAGAFRLQSPPDAPAVVQHPLHADFGDAVRLLGVDPPPETVIAGRPLAVTVYWRALHPLAADYAVFLHLDAPDGETLATADETHPADIPTSHWPPSLYLRNPLQLTVPAGALPIRYTLRVGLYDPQTGQRLPLPGGETAFAVGRVWVEPVRSPRPPDGPRARFGDSIRLLGARFDPAAQTVTLYWQTDAPLSGDDSIFLHLLDAGGARVGQADGTPYGNRYPLPDWRPGQVIADPRPVGAAGAVELAVGVYNPRTGQRLPATDDAGRPLPDNALRIPLAGF